MRRLQKRVLTLIGHLQFRVTFTDAVAARRIVRQAPRDLFPRASYQNQNIHIPWPKPKRPLRKLSPRKPLPRSRPPRRPSPRRRSNEPLSLLFFGQEPPDFRAALLFCGLRRRPVRRRLRAARTPQQKGVGVSAHAVSAPSHFTPLAGSRPSRRAADCRRSG